MSPQNIHEMFRRFQSQQAEPTTELHYESPFQLLIAVILSAQATDKSVNLATARLFKAAPDALSLAAMGVEAVTPYISSIGLYRNKAHNIVATAQIIAQRYQGEVPRDRASLEALPGVGRKTANVVLNTVFEEPTIAVDTHIFRLANRTGLAPGKTVRAVEDRLMKRVPKPFLRHAHHWLILHGRYVCTARKPACESCLVRDLCDYPIRAAKSLARTKSKPKPGPLNGR